MSDTTEDAIRRKAAPDFGLFAPSVEHVAIARDRDPVTSHAGADRIAPKRGSQCATLLAVFRAFPDGLTAREAEQHSGIAGAWKRCSDLTRSGWLAPTGATRDGQRVLRVTP